MCSFLDKGLWDIGGATLFEGEPILSTLLRGGFYDGPENPHVDALWQKIRAEKAAVGAKAKKKRRSRGGKKHRAKMKRWAARAAPAKTGTSIAIVVRVVEESDHT